MPTDKDPDNAENMAAKIAHDINAPIGIAGEIAGAVRQAIPKIIKNTGKAAGIAEGIALEDHKYGKVERAVCGTAKVVAANIAGGKIIGHAAAQGAAAVPYPHPLAKLGGALAGYMAVKPLINEATKPIQKLVGEKCHAIFSNIAAQQTLDAQRARERAMNSFRPPVPVRFLPAPTPAPTRHYTPFHSYSSFSVEARAMQELRSDPRYRQLSFTGQLAAERGVRISCYLGASDFHGSLSLNGLIPSYNSYNIGSIVRDALNGTGEIGGVATEVSLITDIIDSKEHAQAQNYTFCFRAQDCSISSSRFSQVAQEIAKAYFQDKTLPFFSLHFNNQGFSYPVIHPAYENTLVT